MSLGSNDDADPMASGSIRTATPLSTCVCLGSTDSVPLLGGEATDTHEPRQNRPGWSNPPVCIDRQSKQIVCSYTRICISAGFFFFSFLFFFSSNIAGGPRPEEHAVIIIIFHSPLVAERIQYVGVSSFHSMNFDVPCKQVFISYVVTVRHFILSILLILRCV
jgi:hypothetical protein